MNLVANYFVNIPIILQMAEAGFYWTGTKRENDTATCFVCGKTLDGWESEDDPWKEHLKHAPQCEFVKLGCPEKDLTVSAQTPRTTKLTYTYQFTDLLLGGAISENILYCC